MTENWERENGDRRERGLRSTCCHCPEGTAGEYPTTAWSLCRFRLYPWTGYPSGSGQQRRPRDEERFIIWIGPHRRTTVIRDTTRDHADVCGPCFCPLGQGSLTSMWTMQSGLLPEDLAMFLGFVASGGHADVSGMGSHLKPCWDPGAHEADEGHEWVGGPDMAKTHVDIYGPDCLLSTFGLSVFWDAAWSWGCQRIGPASPGRAGPTPCGRGRLSFSVKAWRQQLWHGLGRVMPLPDSHTTVPTMVRVWERQPHNTGGGVGKGEVAPFFSGHLTAFPQLRASGIGASWEKLLLLWEAVH